MTAAPWFVLRCQTGSEAAIAQRLTSDLAVPAFSPQRIESHVLRGTRRESVRPLWTSYVLASWPRDDAHTWNDVAGRDGLGNLIGVFAIIGGGSPTEVPQAEVQGWIDRADASGVIIDLKEKLADMKRGYRRGDQVRIIGGAFDGATGTCQWVDEKGASITIWLLQRQLCVYVPIPVGGARPSVRIERAWAAANPDGEFRGKPRWHRRMRARVSAKAAEAIAPPSAA